MKDNTMESNEKKSGSTMESGNEKIKEKAIEYLALAFNDLNEDNKRGIAVLLMNMQFARSTNDELLSVAFEGVGDDMTRDERFLGPNGLDHRVERLFSIIEHNNRLVGDNVTLAEAQKFLKEQGYDGVHLSDMQYDRAKEKARERALQTEGK